MSYLACTIITGLTATAVMDVWGIARKPLLGMAAPDYAMVGRWVLHMRHGRFSHEAIAAAAPMACENQLGWLVHYLIGIAFAGLLIYVVGPDWIADPTLVPALLFGIATVLLPFLVMQPAMGAGFAAGRTSRPGVARLQSLITHAVFGLGLYVGGWASHSLNAGLL